MTNLDKIGVNLFNKSDTSKAGSQLKAVGESDLSLKVRNQVLEAYIRQSSSVQNLPESKKDYF